MEQNKQKRGGKSIKWHNNKQVAEEVLKLETLVTLV